MTDNVKFYLQDLEVGMRASTSMVITGEKIDIFAELTGDKNPIHVDEDFAKTTMFGKRIAHGALSASLISAVLGNDLPGPGAVFVEVNGKQICRGDAGVMVKKRPAE
jgi:3-hydroxybutyryl-CoA dehydratase